MKDKFKTNWKLYYHNANSIKYRQYLIIENSTFFYEHLTSNTKAIMIKLKKKKTIVKDYRVCRFINYLHNT